MSLFPSKRWLAGLVVAAGCAASFQQSARAAEPALTNLWTVDIGNHCDSSCAIADNGTIYFGAFDGKFWALAPDGTTKWVFKAGREIRSSPALGADGSIYFGSRDRNLYCLHPAGKLKWSFATSAWIDSSPALSSDGQVNFGGWDGRFYALSPAGHKLWEFKTGGPIVSSPAIGMGGAIYFGSHDRKLYALTGDGQKKWEFETGGAILSSPALQGAECLYITSTDGHLYSINLDGTLRWKLHTGSITESSPTIGEAGDVYIGVNKALWVVSREGTKGIEYATHDFLESSATALLDGTFCFISRYGLLLCLTPKRELAWSCYVYGQGYASPGVGRNGTVYLPAYAGQRGFSAFLASQPLASSPWPRFRGNARNTGNIADHMRLTDSR